MALRVTHAPVNVAGIPWENVQALRRKGVDARLVVFNRGKLHPEADWSLDRQGGLPRRLVTQFAALARLLPRTDIFHFLGSDIRGKSPGELAYGRRADAQIVGSYDAIRWVPDAHVVPHGIDLRDFRPAPSSNRARPVVVHAPSNRARKGTEHVVAACRELDVELEIVEGLHHEEARKRYELADIVVDQLNAGWYGVFAIECLALGKPVVTFLNAEAVRRTEHAFGVRVPLVGATRDDLRSRLEPLVASAAERRRIGAESRSYAERVHDLESVGDRLLDLYSRLR